MAAKRFALSAKAVIRDGRGRMLLLRRSMESKHNGGRWDLPGGKLDAGEDFQAALEREAGEEIGLAIRLDRVAGAAESVAPDRIIAYLIMEGRRVSGRVHLSPEHTEFAWVEPRAALGLDVCPQFREFLEGYAARAGRRA